MDLKGSKLSRLLASLGILGILAVALFCGMNVENTGQLRTPVILAGGHSYLGNNTDDDSSRTETNSQRLARIREVCKRIGISPTDADAQQSLQFATKHILVDDTHNALYCFVPKAGCTSWKHLMMRLTSGINNATFSEKYSNISMAHNVEIQKRLGLYRLSDYTPKGQKRRLNSFFKFMITRDPFTRLVSAYNDKFSRRERLFRGKFGKSLKQTIEDDSNDLEFPADNRTVSFAELAPYVVSMYERSLQNGHWHSVSQWCQPCLVHYDYVGKVETMDVDAKNILSNMGTPEAYKFLPHYNAHRHTQDLESMYASIPRQALGGLLKLYRNDTLMFGYKIPSYL